MNSWPDTLSEEETLDLALAGNSIARVGEGELRIALGVDCKRQVADNGLAKEMLNVLRSNIPNLLPCIPRIWDEIPNPKFWLKFRDRKYVKLLSDRKYGSAFITRPDSAHNIDNPTYWKRISGLWVGRDVVLVVGTTRSLMPSFLDGALSVRTVWGPERDAYNEIDRIESEIGDHDGIVLLCLGPTATVLAARLAKRGVWAVDLGHLGMFIKHQGIYRLSLSDLISDDYRSLQIEAHKGEYGVSGKRYVSDVESYCRTIEAEVVLDYGCGEGKLTTSRTLYQYDPAIPGKDSLPKPADLVVCTDVLEHVEPDKIGAVLAHIFALSKKGGFFVVSLRKANLVLADGRNAHLIVKSPEWWVEAIKRSGWKDIQYKQEPNDSLKVWTVK